MQVRAGIFFLDRSMRYAEVEESADRVSLLRLGNCDFDFNAMRALMQGDAADHVETIQEAISDVFAGTQADEVCVALQPESCYSFFTTVPEGVGDDDLKRQVLQETSLVADNETTLYVASEEVLTERSPDGTSATWIHVLALQEEMRKRLDSVLSVFTRAYRRYVPAVQGAAAIIEALERGKRNGSEKPFTMGVGLYDGHTEYALCREGAWYHDHFVLEAAPTDRVYFAAAMLRRLGASTEDVGHIYTYGEEYAMSDLDPFKAVFGVTPRALDPLQVVQVEGQSGGGFSAAAYVPCIGVTV